MTSPTTWRSFDEWCDQALIEADYPDVRCIPQIRQLLQGAWNAGRITARSETACRLSYDPSCRHHANAAPSAAVAPRVIDAEAGKYPMNGDALLAILRGIKDDENRGVDKDRRRGAMHAVDRCFWAVESWLRTIPSASVALTLQALDRMIESVQEEIGANDVGNYATIGALRGEEKGLRAARLYLERASAATDRSSAK